MKWREWKEKKGTYTRTYLSLSSAQNLQKLQPKQLLYLTSMDTIMQQRSWEVSEVVRLLNIWLTYDCIVCTRGKI